MNLSNHNQYAFKNLLLWLLGGLIARRSLFFS